jgi:hypothetical protein
MVKALKAIENTQIGTLNGSIADHLFKMERLRRSKLSSTPEESSKND